jgi:hypothetical protein
MNEVVVNNALFWVAQLARKSFTVGDRKFVKIMT